MLNPDERNITRASIQDCSVLVKHKDGTKSILIDKFIRTNYYGLNLQVGDKFNYDVSEYEVLYAMGGLVQIKDTESNFTTVIYRDGSDLEMTLRERENE